MVINLDEDIEKKVLNIAIVGGGKSCRSLLEIVSEKTFTYFDIIIKGVCDIDQKAEGFVLAKKNGIFTTTNFKELYNIENLNSIIELTHDNELLLKLIESRPSHIGIFEHNLFDQLKSFFLIDQRLKSAETQIVFEKMISDFLIQESSQRILILNTDFTISEVNEEYLSVIGKSRQEVVGSFCYKTIQGFNVPCSIAQAGFTCPMVETLRTGKSSHIILEDPDSGDVSKYIDVLTYPVKDKTGEITRVIEVWRDITKQFSPKLENKVKAITEDIQKLIHEDRMISLGKLSASCVHEINNPIQGLLTYSCLMKDMIDEGASPKDIEKFKEYLSLMIEELERCGEIVSGLLSFSRENTKEYKDLDLNGVLDSVISLTKHKMKLQNIKMVKDLSDELLIIKGDTNSLQQCFLNLVFNSVEAMPDGGTLRISSKLDIGRDKIVIEFADSGDGVSEKNLDHIFEPFFTTKGQGEGTGLGLSIVYGIIKNHTGDIRVESSDGANFVIEFPYTS
jgi:signal transduction histidine kinase